MKCLSGLGFFYTHKTLNFFKKKQTSFPPKTETSSLRNRFLSLLLVHTYLKKKKEHAFARDRERESEREREIIHFDLDLNTLQEKEREREREREFLRRKLNWIGENSHLSRCERCRF